MPFRGFLARHGWLIAVAVTYLYVFPYFPRIQSANELPRVYLMRAIADEHTFAIDSGVKRFGGTADVSPSGGRTYSNKAPGSSMLAAPPYWIASMIAGEPELPASMWIARVFGGIIPALLFLMLLYRFLERYTPDPAIRQLVCLAYALGSLAMTYSILFYSHQLAAACVASAWIFGLEAAEGKRGNRGFAAAGALAGCSALVDYQAVFAVVPVAIHVLVKLLARPRREIDPRGFAPPPGGAGRVPPLWRGLVIATIAAAIPIVVLLAYHAICFGSPWRTGYDASETFAHHHQAGFLGITELRWEAFVGSFLRLDNGLIPLAPWLVLAIPGTFVLARGLHHARGESRRIAISDRWRVWIEVASGSLLVVAALAIGVLTVQSLPRTLTLIAMLAAGVVLIVIGCTRLAPARDGDLGTACVGLAVLAIYTLFISSINFWRGGWGVGPRYITAMLPFLLPAIAVALVAVQRRNRFAFGALVGLILVGVAVYTLSAVTFPYWPDSMRHPLYDVTLRMLREDLVAPNLGSALGIDGVLGVVPVLAVVAFVVARVIWTIAGPRALAIAIAVATAILAIYGQAPHGGVDQIQKFYVVWAAQGRHPSASGPSCGGIVLGRDPANIHARDGKVTFCHEGVVTTTSVAACRSHERHADTFPAGGCLD